MTEESRRSIDLTVTIPDPGEWCNGCPLLCDAPLSQPNYVICAHGHKLPDEDSDAHIRRPPECHAAQKRGA